MQAAVVAAVQPAAVAAVQAAAAAAAPPPWAAQLQAQVAQLQAHVTQLQAGQAQLQAGQAQLQAGQAAAAHNAHARLQNKPGADANMPLQPLVREQPGPGAALNVLPPAGAFPASLQAADGMTRAALNTMQARAPTNGKGHCRSAAAARGGRGGRGGSAPGAPAQLSSANQCHPPTPTHRPSTVSTSRAEPWRHGGTRSRFSSVQSKGSTCSCARTQPAAAATRCTAYMTVACAGGQRFKGEAGQQPVGGPAASAQWSGGGARNTQRSKCCWLSCRSAS